MDTAGLARRSAVRGARGSDRPGGGGGWGDPLEREPERVAEDVRHGFVSIDGAKRDYGVVIDEESLEVNVGQTEKLRTEIACS